MEKNQTQVIQFEPFERQARVFTSTKRIIIVIAGVQGGKTTSGIYWSQLQIQNNPDKNGLICGLSHDQLSNVIIEKFFSTFPFYKKHFVKKEKTLYLPTGGKVFFRPLEDPKYVEGITASWAWIDEGDLVSYKAYLVVRGRLGSTGGRLLITSSLADGGWLGGYAEKMSEAQDIDVISWRSVDNPSFSKEEWEALKKRLTRLFSNAVMRQFLLSTQEEYIRFLILTNTWFPLLKKEKFQKNLLLDLTGDGMTQQQLLF